MPGLERRSDKLTLAAVKIALTNENAVADQWLKSFVRHLAFIEIIGMFDEEAMYQSRVIYLDDGIRTEVKATDVATLTHYAHEKFKPVAIKLKEIT